MIRSAWLERTALLLPVPLLGVLLLFEIAFGASPGLPYFSRVFNAPAFRVRSMFLEILAEAGGHLEREKPSDKLVEGTLGGYPFTFRMNSSEGDSTEVSFKVIGGNQEESRSLETLMMNLLTARLSKREEEAAGKSGVLAASAYEKVTVCLYGTSNNETFQCSGVFISVDGLILTTAHEISEAQSLFVKLPDKNVIKGRIEYLNKVYDLALVSTGLKVFNAISLPAPKTLKVSVGKLIYGLGCPYGLMGTIAKGRISAAPRMVGSILLYQCDLPAYPGNSGGPVFDDQGDLIGLIKGRLKDTSDISFVIPAFYLAIFAKKAAKEKSYRMPKVEKTSDWVDWFALGLATTDIMMKEKAFRQVLALRPGFAPALYHLGLLLNRAQRLREELAVWKQLVTRNPEWGDAWYRMGNAYFKAGSFRNAEKAYKNAIRASDSDPRYYNNLGEIYRREKKLKKAEIYFKKALSLNPRYALAHYNLGVLFDQELDKPEIAVYHYREYLRLRPEARDRKQVEGWIKQAEKRF